MVKRSLRIEGGRQLWILTLKVVNHPRESAFYPVADQRQNNNDHSKNQHKRALSAIGQNVCVRTAQHNIGQQNDCSNNERPV